MNIELSKRIAERVMNWRIHCRNTAHYVKAGQENEIVDHAEAWHDWDCETPDAMVRIMEAMRANGYAFDMRCHPGRPTLANFRKIPTGPYVLLPVDIDEYVRGETMPLAVAMAALKAVEASNG